MGCVMPQVCSCQTFPGALRIGLPSEWPLCYQISVPGRVNSSVIISRKRSDVYFSTTWNIPKTTQDSVFDAWQGAPEMIPAIEQGWISKSNLGGVTERWAHLQSISVFTFYWLMSERLSTPIKVVLPHHLGRWLPAPLGLVSQAPVFWFCTSCARKALHLISTHCLSPVRSLFQGYFSVRLSMKSQRKIVTLDSPNISALLFPTAPTLIRNRRYTVSLFTVRLLHETLSSRRDCCLFRSLLYVQHLNGIWHTGVIW